MIPEKNNLSFKRYIDFIVISVSSDHTHNRIQNGNGHQLSLFGFRVKEVLSLSIITNYCLTSHFCIFQNFKANEGIKKKKSTEWYLNCCDSDNIYIVTDTQLSTALHCAIMTVIICSYPHYHQLNFFMMLSRWPPMVNWVPTQIIKSHCC